MIRFIHLGKFKNKHYKNLFLAYLSNINKYTKAEEIEVKVLEDSPWYFDKNKDKILKYLDFNFNIVFTEHGTIINSLQFSNIVSKNINKLNIIVGTSWGVPDFILAKADFKIALARLTMPHELVRLIAAEQVYRAFTIINGEKYNK
jgi:23S rRNA (pseudouridine1915-N3)-methyltransferase